MRNLIRIDVLDVFQRRTAVVYLIEIHICEIGCMVNQYQILLIKHLFRIVGSILAVD